MWELSREFRITINKVLENWIEKMSKIQEQMGNVSKEMETLRKNQKKMLDIKIL